MRPQMAAAGHGFWHRSHLISATVLARQSHTPCSWPCKNHDERESRGEIVAAVSRTPAASRSARTPGREAAVLDLAQTVGIALRGSGFVF